MTSRDPEGAVRKYGPRVRYPSDSLAFCCSVSVFILSALLYFPACANVNDTL